jgi:hypothetical protein
MRGDRRVAERLRVPTATSCCRNSQESFAVDIELKRTAKSVIDRIVHLRDSL